MQGTVKFYKISKGFGFIAGDDGIDYYFHVSDVMDSIPETTMVGTKVTFTPLETRRGIMGKEVASLKEETCGSIEEDSCEKSLEYLKQIDKILYHKQLSSIIFLCTLLILALSAMNILLYHITFIHFISNVFIMLLSFLALYLLVKQKKQSD